LPKKYKLSDMSWKEAEEAFKSSDTVIVPTGTLHAHGPTPIGIDATAPEKIADEVGKKIGMLVLPVTPYGEDDKMANYPGSIGISPGVLEMYYTDILSNLHRNGVRKVVFVNGHGGNRESLTRAGRNVRKLGMLVAILEWWTIAKDLSLYPTGTDYLQEMSIGVAIHGKENIDLREETHRGEWGTNPTKKILGAEITPVVFTNFKFRGATVTIPVDAWEIDLSTPPYIKPEELPKLEAAGNELIRKFVDYTAEFAKEFEKIEVESLKP
jgi:creatinine amidohydrolase/Fe(II)-dependent formamide hydrolase-like protein